MSTKIIFAGLFAATLWFPALPAAASSSTTTCDKDYCCTKTVFPGGGAVLIECVPATKPKDKAPAAARISSFDTARSDLQ